MESIKWLDRPFDRRHIDTLGWDAGSASGFEPGHAGLVAVSRARVAPKPHANLI